MRETDRKDRGLLVVAGAVAVLGLMLVQAGSLEPPGPPAPTMRTLDEIYDMLASLQAGGQTVGTENRLKGCVRITGSTQGVLRSRETADATDPACSAFGEQGIRVLAMAHDLFVPVDAFGQPTGQRQHSPLVLTKHVDGATPLLLRALHDQELLDDVELRWHRTAPAGGTQHYLTIQLDDARVAGVTPTVLATPQTYMHLEEVAFAYHRIRWIWPQSGAEFEDTWGGGGGGTPMKPMWLLAVLLLAPLPVGTDAGDLQPPGPPGPTMRSLSEAFELAATLEGQQGLFGTSVGAQADERLQLFAWFEGQSQGVMQGDVMLHGYEESSEVFGLSHSVDVPLATDGSPAGPPRHARLTVRMNVESNSLNLYQALATGERLSVELKWTRPDPGGGREHYFTTELTDAYVVDLSKAVVPTPAGFSHAVDVALTYGTITWSYEPAGVVYSYTRHAP